MVKAHTYGLMAKDTMVSLSMAANTARVLGCLARIRLSKLTLASIRMTRNVAMESTSGPMDRRSRGNLKMIRGMEWGF